MFEKILENWKKGWKWAKQAGKGQKRLEMGKKVWKMSKKAKKSGKG